MAATAPAVVIAAAEPGDAGEILTVQRAAFVAEAQLYGDPFIAPLVESAEQIRAAIERGAVALKALDGHRLVGAVRALPAGRSCLVSRLAVAPDRQGGGVGRALLAALPDAVAAAAPEAEDLVVHTGHLSAEDLRLYRGFGFAETGRERMDDHLTLVHLRRAVRPAPA
ncbi:GNAT family N-acetyltransferase [Allonocardiopsis opalescens]|uniref:Acetyltransferase (GNAT) family protein n=1 Tax=Allonocardiopsis opalescens TaxID=1144618 RepID=A0A2T0Q4A2_9ACTN|nr:GNAT family N-acetyltransferase [Allonocardiopsis opalescens]PRX98636.1 acetyltransferase (GNAT) family protein [Allonocardiopsis opalescens]